MSTAVLIATTGDRAELPPIVRHRIVAFLAAGGTGKIILNVKCGEIRSCEMTEVIDAQTPLDNMIADVKRSPH